ncbi:MAG: type II toxin-antitoxin system RelE/ParE family toxin [Myxococcales bacterium]|nr:type II toxin-antitoxin system RelE/ParE family toxin [Myxococcales bacterium]
MKTEFSDSAKAELRSAREHYDAERAGLGREFLLEMREIVSRIRTTPLQFPAIGRTEARRALGSRFPYQIVFFVLADRVRIIAVAHQHRKPRYWRGRS